MQIPKFRAWHKEHKRMLKVINLEWLGDEFESLFKICTWQDGDSIFGTHYDPSEIELMQWTGLQYDDDKDAYEGDIIEHYWDDPRGCQGIARYQIIRDKYNHQLCLESEEYSSELPADFYDSVKYLGNIHENPELLK